ncbi:MAG: hypothetical protein IPJ56_02505 [Gemmatimonadetes bacterium]|nr:hypothetical protein [Gemmatimonadota bacterium]
MKLNDLATASKLAQEGVTLARAITESPKASRDDLYGLSVALDRLGEIRVQQGDTTAALASLRESLVIRRRLAAEEPRNASWQATMSVSLSIVAQLEAASRDVSAARAHYEENLPTLEVLAVASPNIPNAQRRLTRGFSEFADLLMRIDSQPAALQRYREGLEAAERAAARFPTHYAVQRDHFVLLWTLASIDSSGVSWQTVLAQLERMNERVQGLLPFDVPFLEEARRRAAGKSERPREMESELSRSSQG